MPALDIIFEFVHRNVNGRGQAVDADIRVDFFEGDELVTPKESRVLGVTERDSIVQTVVGLDTFYTTTLDAITFAGGKKITAKWFANDGGTPTDPNPLVEVKPYPRTGILNFDDIKGYVREFLGFPVVNVEITDQQLNRVVERALEKYNQHMAELRRGVVILVPGQNKYPLPDVPDRGISRVEFLRKEGTPLISDPLFGREYPRGQQLDFDQFALGQSFFKTLLRITSQEPEWRWEVSDKTLYIDIGGTDVSGDSGSFFVTFEFFQERRLETLPNNHFRWFRAYSLALAKEMVGRVRMKFSGAINAPGGQLTLDGQILLEESKAEQERLGDEIRSWEPELPPMMEGL